MEGLCVEGDETVPKAGVDDGGSGSKGEGEVVGGADGEGLPPSLFCPTTVKDGKLKLLGWLLAEEEKLEKLLEGPILTTLVWMNQKIVGKQDEIDQLTKKLMGMKGGSGRGGVSCSGGGSSAVLVVSGNEAKATQPQAEGRNWGLVFPEEIWERIFNNMTDSKDLQSCSKACPIFNRILHPRKTDFLFHQVFPQLCRELDNELILSYRQVSRAWNEGVDEYLEDHPSSRPFDVKNFNPRDPDLAPPMKLGGIHRYSNGGVADLRRENFLEKMKDHRRNPFVGRSVTITVFEGHQMDWDVMFGRYPPQRALPSEDDDDDFSIDQEERQQLQFWNGLFQFLGRFGKHIFYLNFEVIGTGAGDLLDWSVTKPFNDLLKKILSSAPNLRRLRISGTFATPFPHLEFPVAPQLETLHIDKVEHRLNPVVLSLIRKYHPQLKKLRIKWETWQHLYYSQKSVSDLNWNNLRELHIVGKIRGSSDTDPLVNWSLLHLGKLVLTPGLHDRTGVVSVNPHEYDFGKVLDVVINLSLKTQLRVLRIVKGFEVEQLSLTTLFAPPTLTTLEVEHGGSESDYTFLLRFPFLKNLIIFWPEEDYFQRRGREICYKDAPMSNYDHGNGGGSPGKKVVMELHRFMYEKRMYDCKIWELLPRLKVFTFQRDVYTREEYERLVTRAQNAEKAKVV